MKTNVIYPYGPLVDLLSGRDARRVYAIEFQPSSVIKVGWSKVVGERLPVVATEGIAAGLTPTRFIVSPIWSNARRVEQAILATLRDETDPFLVGSEWFQGVSLDRVADLLSDWVARDNDHGHPVALRASDLAALEAAELGEVPA